MERGKAARGITLLGLVALLIVVLILPSPAQGTAPQITDIDFPDTIQADGNPVDGVIFFADPDGDVAWCVFELLQGDRSTIEITPDWEFDPQVKGETEGFIDFTIAVSATVTQQFKLKVTLFDEAGNESEPYELAFEAVVLNQPPVADFTYAPAEPHVGEEVTFDASPSYDPDSRITSYDWDFGDGSTGSGKETSHIYSSEGGYTVTLKVTDDKGATGSTSKTIEVLPKPNQPPVAKFSFSPSEPKVGETVTFDASESYDPDGHIIDYSWDFGDGSTGHGERVTHSFSSARTYTIKLTVTDDGGLSDSTTHQVTVHPKPQPPVARFTYSPSQPEVGQSVRFDASSSYDPDGRITKYEWSFGDGSRRSGKTVYHSYSSARSYTVTLKVTDDDGLTDSVSKTITVKEKPNQPPRASFSYSPSYLHVADRVNFNASGSRDPDGTITKYEWSFGDGSRGSGREISHRYGRQGSYTVRLTVTDNRGGTDTSSHTITVRPLTSNPWRGSKNVHLIFNCQYAPYNIAAFRQAVAVMIDRGEVTGQVRGVTPAYSIVPSGNSYWHNGDVKRWGEGMNLARRVKTAVDLLKRAGFRWEQEPIASEWSGQVTQYGRGLIMPNGQVLGEQSLMHPNAADDNAANLFGMMIAKWLNMLGIPVRAEPSSTNAIWGSVEEGLFDMAIVPWDFGSGGFPQYLYNLFASSQVSPDGLNYSGYESSEYDDVALEFLHATSDSQARDRAYRLQEILAEKVPHVVLYERRW